MSTTRASSLATVKKPRATKAQPASQPTQEDIALRAYHIYLERGGAPGNPFEDWTRAESELVGGKKKPGRKASQKTVAA